MPPRFFHYSRLISIVIMHSIHGHKSSFLCNRTPQHALEWLNEFLLWARCYGCYWVLRMYDAELLSQEFHTSELTPNGLHARTHGDIYYFIVYFIVFFRKMIIAHTQPMREHGTTKYQIFYSSNSFMFI